jgi:hypothetical protein
LHAPNTPIASGYNLTVNWTIVKEGTSEVTRISGDWNANYSQVVDFAHTFSSAGRRIISLSITYRN